MERTPQQGLPAVNQRPRIQAGFCHELASFVTNGARIVTKSDNIHVRFSAQCHDAAPRRGDGRRPRPIVCQRPLVVWLGVTALVMPLFPLNVAGNVLVLSTVVTSAVPPEALQEISAYSLKGWCSLQAFAERCQQTTPQVRLHHRRPACWVFHEYAQPQRAQYFVPNGEEPGSIVRPESERDQDL